MKRYIIPRWEYNIIVTVQDRFSERLEFLKDVQFND